MTCKNAKRTDQGWECTVAKKSHADALFQIRAYAQKSTNGLKTQEGGQKSMRLMQNHYYSKSAIDIMKGERVDGISQKRHGN